MGGGGGKGSLPTPEPVWKQAGYGSEAEYQRAQQEARDSAARLATSQQELTRMQAESAARASQLASEQLATQQSALEAQQKAVAAAEAKRQAEATALEERTKRRLSLAASRGGSLLTGGMGATGQMPVQRKSLLGQ